MTPGPPPPLLYLNVAPWVVALTVVVVLAGVLALKVAQYRCRLRKGERCRRLCDLHPRVNSAGRRVSTMPLAAVLMCVSRVLFSFVITTRMYYVDPEKWKYLWVHVVSIGVGLLLGSGTVVLFFRRLARTYLSDGVIVAELSAWSVDNASVLRVLKLLAVVKPAVLALLQSGLSASLDIPVPAVFPGWRLVAGGDAFVTCIGDSTQVVLLILSCRQFNEPIVQLGVRPSCAVWSCLVTRAKCDGAV